MLNQIYWIVFHTVMHICDPTSSTKVKAIHWTVRSTWVIMWVIFCLFIFYYTCVCNETEFDNQKVHGSLWDCPWFSCVHNLLNRDATLEVGTQYLPYSTHIRTLKMKWKFSS